MFQTLLMGAIMGVLLLLLLSLCWSKCAGDDSCGDGKDQQGQQKSTVVAQEIKPGILVIQGGTNEETMRIVQEYEAIRAHSHHQAPALYNYGSNRTLAHYQQQAPAPQMMHGAPGMVMAPSYQGGGPSAPVPALPSAPQAAAASAPDPSFQLIDFDPSDPLMRPPPYAHHEHERTQSH